MSDGRLMTWQRATALVPLALLSAGWTASLTAPTTASAVADEARLPDGTTLPSEAIEAPASVSQPGAIAPGVPEGSARAIVAGASANGIPDAALTAYRRAAQVIDTADKSCHIEWTLIAAIGRVESDHGRYGNNALTDSGVSEPGIYGIPLDGSNGTANISDTDAGELDDDPVFDRAVGPMQFIPSTWSVVGVDGDGDGVRNPQDIDDAALATAVYLCSGEEDLATDAGRRSAVYRYNHSQAYVDLVLSIMAAYSEGNFAAIPNGVTSPATFTPTIGGASPGTSSRPGKGNRPGGTGGGTGGGSGGGSGNGDDTPAAPAPTTPPAGGTGGNGGTGGSGGSGPGGGGGGGSSPAPDAPTPNVPDPTQIVEPVVPVLVSAAQAAQLCTAELQRQFGAAPAQAVQQCADALSGKTVPQAQAAVPGVVSGLADLVASLLPPLPDLPGGLG